MKKNANGFLGLTTILIILIAVLIGGMGYSLFMSRSRVINTNSDPQNTSKNIQDKTATQTAPGYEFYEDSNYALQYPVGWVAKNNNSQPEWVFFSSPDYRAQDVGPSTVTQAGYLLEIRVTPTGTNVPFEQSLKNVREKQDHTSGEIVKIDGHDALLSNVGTDGQAGTILTATTFVNGKTYYFRINGATHTAADTKQLLNDFLSSVKFR